MRHILLTFFAIILCYSLFWDSDKEPRAVDKVNYIHNHDASRTDVFFSPDTLYYYCAIPNNCFEVYHHAQAAIVPPLKY